MGNTHTGFSCPDGPRTRRTRWPIPTPRDTRNTCLGPSLRDCGAHWAVTLVSRVILALDAMVHGPWTDIWSGQGENATSTPYERLVNHPIMQHRIFKSGTIGVQTNHLANQRLPFSGI